MMCAGRPARPVPVIRVTEYRRMSAPHRPARAVAIAAAQESRRRLVAIGTNCVLAAILMACLLAVAL